MSDVLGMILAGGEGSRLKPLTETRAKPSVPFGGSYRLIDFALNNFINADLMRIYVLTQFKSQSLYLHMKKGWSVSEFKNRFIHTIPAQMLDGKRWYEGTADAIYQNITFIEHSDVNDVCIFGSDHIYKMDIRQMLNYHRNKSAKLTVAAIRVPINEASNFGVIEVNREGVMVGFEEKPIHPQAIPGHPGWALVSMGNYIFNAEALCHELREDAENSLSSHDFGKDIIPKMMHHSEVYVYDFSTNSIKGELENSYWRDVGTIDSYWSAHMDLLGKAPLFSLYNRSWPLHTYYPPLPSATFVNSGRNKVKVIDSVVSAGSYVQGAKIHKSVLGFRSNVAEDTFISESIILGDVKIGSGCSIRRTIIDKHVEIAPGTVIGENLELDKQRFHVSESGIVVIKKGEKVGF
ncbi:glucose-1-phosphate adenylyltransferase [Vibrio sp. AK197]